MPIISVIIPTWNEAATICDTIATLNREDCELEVIVVDGGSPDDTCERARTAGADEVFVLETGGRPFQMNEGAARASQESEWLLFLHADTVLPGSGLSQIANQPASVVGGAFQRRFDSSSWLLGLTAWISDFRSCRGIFLGDQAIFVRREVFEKLEGYDTTFTMCEDIDFTKRMRELGDTAMILGPAISSARRFDKLGVFVRSVLDFWITFRFLANQQKFRR